jgi:DNA-binding CsgD family transcriptional regulator
VKEEIKNKCYLLSLEGYTGIDIASKLNISRGTVSKAINSIMRGNDYQLAVKSCGVLLEEYTRFQDYCKKKLKELADMSPDDNRDRIAIIRLQTDIYKDLLTMGASGDFINSVRLIRDKLNEVESGSNIQES